MKYRVRHVVEYAALRGLMAVLGAMPYRVALAFGWLVACLLWIARRDRVRVALSRIRSVLGRDTSPRAARRIAWISLRNTVFNAIEMARAPEADVAWVRSISNCGDSLPVVREHGRQGMIIAVPHMGNWELAGVACRLFDIRMISIAATQRNPLFNRYLNRLRSGPGAEIVERGSAAMRTVARKLRSGMAMAILPDVRVRDEGMPMPFLGGTANIGKGMALFARLAAVPIVPCVVTRQGWARHHIEVFEPVRADMTADRDSDLRRMTGQVLDIIERNIRRSPEQWFWYNKRWVLEPPDAPRTSGPDGPEDVGDRTPRSAP